MLGVMFIQLIEVILVLWNLPSCFKKKEQRGIIRFLNLMRSVKSSAPQGGCIYYYR